MTAHAFTPPPPTRAAVLVLSTRGLTKTYGMTTALAGVFLVRIGVATSRTVLRGVLAEGRP